MKAAKLTRHDKKALLCQKAWIKEQQLRIVDVSRSIIVSRQVAHQNEIQLACYIANLRAGISGWQPWMKKRGLKPFPVKALIKSALKEGKSL